MTSFCQNPNSTTTQLNLTLVPIMIPILNTVPYRILNPNIEHNIGPDSESNIEPSIEPKIECNIVCIIGSKKFLSKIF